MLNAINSAGSAGILVVTAAGNNGPNDGSRTTGWNNDSAGQAIYPSSYNSTNLISVAATSDDDVLTGFSNYGPTSVDMAAPGENIFSPTFSSNTSTGFSSGTSFAAPMVAGAAALAFSMKPDLTTQQVKDAIVLEGDALTSLSGKTVSGRRLNLFNTLDHIHTTHSAFHKTAIGDEGGGPVADDWLLEVSGSNTLIKKYVSGSGYTTLATVANSGSKRIGIFGLAGNDYVTVGTGVTNPLYINGGEGNDVIQGGDGNDTILGEAGNDSITAGSGADSLLGGSGNDTLRGGNGNDTLKGQGNVDAMYGDAGDDTFDAVDSVADSVLNGGTHSSGDIAYYDNPEDVAGKTGIETNYPS